MNLLENIIVLEIFCCFVLEILNVGSCTKGLLNLAQEKNDFDVRRLFEFLYILNERFLHLVWEGIEVFGTIHVDETDFVFDFCLTDSKQDLAEERCETFGDNIHIYFDKFNEVIIFPVKLRSER